eukprot:m.193885 g.193885  ORF g.193885 m.193885 type:complete len:369 (-) comp10070_c0_seq19:1749-2855(-)
MEGQAKLEDQQRLFEEMLPQCTGEDLKYIIRLIRSDLRIYAGPKYVLSALDAHAYEAFQASNDLYDVVSRVRVKQATGDTKKLSVRATLMTPVRPMLAEVCRSLENAVTQCPNGMYCELKYDGQRVQIHKSGDVVSFFNRSLKPITPHKAVNTNEDADADPPLFNVEDFRASVPRACPPGTSFILDCEVVMMSTTTGQPLPLGALYVPKKASFADAVPCLFVFDILQLNHENLLDRPMKERRAILEKNLTEIPYKIQLSRSKLMTTEAELRKAMSEVMAEGLEGLILKNVDQPYEPGKRHWMKVKQDYLEQVSLCGSVVGWQGERCYLAFDPSGDCGVDIFGPYCIVPDSDSRGVGVHFHIISPDSGV